MPRFYTWILACLLASGAWSAELTGSPELNVSGTTGTVRWQTDVPTGARVLVLPEGHTVRIEVTPGISRDHSATLLNVQPGRPYKVVVGTAKVWLATNTLQIVPGKSASPTSTRSKPASDAPPVREIWGNPASLRDHFERHGADFGAKTPEEYARMAWDFLQRASKEGLPAKLDEDDVLRVYDPKSDTFAAYNRNRTARTFFKPNSRGYFERQPGRAVDLKKLK